MSAPDCTLWRSLYNVAPAGYVSLLDALGDENRRSETKAQSPLWSPAVITPRRAKHNVRQVSYYVYDLDGSDALDFQAVRQLGLAAIWHVTHSHSADAPKARLVLFPSRAVDAADHLKLWLALRERVCPGSDAQCKDPSRAYCLPPSGAELNWIDGGRVDVDAWLAIAPEPPPRTVSTVVDGDCPEELERDARWTQHARKTLAAFPPAEAGGGGGLLLKAAAVALRGWLLPREDADALLREAYNPRCKPPWDFTNPDHASNWERTLDRAEEIGDVAWGSERPLNGLNYCEWPHEDPSTRVACAGELRSEGPDIEALCAEGKIRSVTQWVAAMNAKHCVLTAEGGRCRVMSWDHDEVVGASIILQPITDFKARYAPHKALVEGCDKELSIGDWWLQSSNRKQATGLTLRPDKADEIVHGKLNMWKGYGVEPAEGSWELFHRLIREVIASGNEEHYQYIIRWTAWVLQNPGRRAEIVLVLRGKQGTGKTTFLDVIRQCFGMHGMMVTQAGQITGRFNGHLAHTCFLYANEAVAPQDKQSEAALKALITDATVAIERKHIDTAMVVNRLSIAMSSNESWVVPVSSEGDRRFCVFDVDRQGLVDFGAVHQELKAGGAAAFLADMLGWDLRGWHPRDSVPQTDAKASQLVESLKPSEKAVYDMLWLGEIGMPQPRIPTELPEGARFVSPAYWLETKFRGSTRVTLRRLAKALRAVGVAGRAEVEFERRRGFWLPRLATARRAWEEHYGTPGDWPHDDGEWV